MLRRRLRDLRPHGPGRDPRGQRRARGRHRRPGRRLHDHRHEALRRDRRARPQTPCAGRRSSTPGSCASAAAARTESAEKVVENAPYWWPTGMNPEQADAHLAELVGKQLVGKPAEFAGDEALQTEERVFGWIQAETETGEYKDRNDAFEQCCSRSTAARSRRPVDLHLRPVEGRRRSRRRPSTRHAGRRRHHRDHERRPAGPRQHHQGGHQAGLLPGVGHRPVRAGRHHDLRPYVRPGAVGARLRRLGLPTARAERELTDAFIVYEWYYGEAAGEHARPCSRRRPSACSGIHLAGPDLTPETFERGMFRYPRYDTAARPTARTRGARTCGRRPTATAPTTPPPSGGTPRPPARTRPATRAPA